MSRLAHGIRGLAPGRGVWTGAIARGAAAHAGGLVWVAGVQLLSVPVLIGAWGVEAFGVWLMLSTLPVYLAFADLGALAATQSAVTLRWARGDRAGARVAFHTACAAVAAVTGLLIAVALGLWLVPDSSGLADVAGVLAVYAAAVLLARLPVVAMRATGFYARATLVFDLAIGLEGAALLSVAIVGGHFLAGALAMLAMRLVVLAALLVALRRSVPALGIGLTEASGREARRLAPMALAALALPLAVAINVHGMALVAGLAIAPAAAAVYGPVRTASRIAVQLAGLVNRAAMPEMAVAYARTDHSGQKRLGAMHLAVLVAVVLPCAAGLAVFGPDLVRVWTGGRISADPVFVALMALAMVFHAGWTLFANLLLATEHHIRPGWAVLAIAVCGAVAAVPAARHWGLGGMAGCLVGVEALAALVVARAFSRFLRPGRSP